MPVSSEGRLAQLVQGPSHAREMADHLKQQLDAISTQLDCDTQLIDDYTPENAEAR